MLCTKDVGKKVVDDLFALHSALQMTNAVFDVRMHDVEKESREFVSQIVNGVIAKLLVLPRLLELLKQPPLVASEVHICKLTDQIRRSYQTSQRIRFFVTLLVRSRKTRLFDIVSEKIAVDEGIVRKTKLYKLLTAIHMDLAENSPGRATRVVFVLIFGEKAFDKTNIVKGTRDQKVHPIVR